VECYDHWLSTRTETPKDPIKVYQKALVAQLTAKDGRKAFTEEEERAIMVVLKKKQMWPCSPKGRRVGINGLRPSTMGYHERLASECNDD
jgi:hypothetical protein